MPKKGNNKDVVQRKESKSEIQNRITRTNHLLIIGIDQYENDNVPNLNNAVRDAKKIKDLLVNQYKFLPENITTLFNKEATRRNVMDAFSEMLDKLTNQDNLIFYYSGHGTHLKSGKSKRGYWIPSDAELNKEPTYIPNNEIILLFKNSRAHHVFGIVDSCFSGSLFPHRKLATSTADERIDSFPSRWLLTAGRLETVSDGMSGANSPFAEALLTYLKNNPDNSFWVSDLCNRVLKGFNYNVKKQTPRGEALQDVGHHGGQFVFHKKDYVPKVETIVTPMPSPNRNLEAPSFFEKNRKYLLFLFIPLLVFGYLLWENNKKIPLLGLNFSLKNDLLIANIEGGKPPYFLQLLKDNKQKYSTRLEKAKGQEIPILKEYRVDAGMHQLIVKDDKGNEVSKVVNIDPLKTTGTFIDARKGGQTYKWVRLKDGKKWMAQNLNFNIPGSWCYKEENRKCSDYGRLYNWQAAKSACPNGWKLPSVEDWWDMASHYGPIHSKSKNITGSDELIHVYQALMEKGSSGFSALHSGLRYPKKNFERINTHAYYWTSTAQSTSDAWRYRFDDQHKGLDHHFDDIRYGFSCRCIEVED